MHFSWLLNLCYPSTLLNYALMAFLAPFFSHTSVNKQLLISSLVLNSVFLDLQTEGCMNGFSFHPSYLLLRRYLQISLSLSLFFFPLENTMLGSSQEKKAFHIKIQTELFMVSESQPPNFVQACHHASQPNTEVILRQHITVEQPRPIYNVRKHFLGQ